MIKLDEKSNAQAWELEVTCRNKKYLDEVVKAILKYGMINFEVELVECLSNHEEYNGRYTVLMWCSWFHNLADIAKDLSEIEDKFEKI
jgi:hypothetical protein